MPPEVLSASDLDRMAHDWMVRVQLGDASGPGESDGERAKALAAFEAWRAEDPAHAAAYERVKASVEVTDYLPLGRMVATSKLSRLPFSKRHPVLVGALAASLVAVVGFGAYRALVPGTMAGQQASIPGADAHYVTMVGEKRDINLPDGSHVLLDADSELRVQYSATARTLRLDRGRARFTVTHDAARAFAVDAGDGRVIAHGTIFVVAVEARGVHVALVRGSIEVARQAAQRTQVGDVSSRMLLPGQQLTFSPNAPLPTPQPTPPGELDWVSGRLSFNDARLGDAIDEINRYNTVKIILGEPAVADLRVSGGFEAAKPEAFANAVARALGLKLVPQAGGRLLLAPAHPIS